MINSYLLEKLDGKLVYLASPHNHTNPATRHYRTAMSLYCAASLASYGVVVYPPLIVSQQISNLIGNDLDHIFWMKFDMKVMEKCDCVVLLKLPGWDTSVGVGVELQFFEKAGKPIYMLEVPETWEFNEAGLPYA